MQVTHLPTSSVHTVAKQSRSLTYCENAVHALSSGEVFLGFLFFQNVGIDGPDEVSRLPDSPFPEFHRFPFLADDGFSGFRQFASGVRNPGREVGYPESSYFDVDELRSPDAGIAPDNGYQRVGLTLVHGRRGVSG